MRLLKRICACIFMVAVTAGFCVAAAETDTPAKQQAAPGESSAFIDLQLENISVESGRAAARDMLLGTVSSLSGGNEPRIVEDAGSGQSKLSFSWISAVSFALVLAVFFLFVWFFFRPRRKNVN